MEFRKDILKIGELQMLEKLNIDMEFNSITSLLQKFGYKFCAIRRIRIECICTTSIDYVT